MIFLPVRRAALVLSAFVLSAPLNAAAMIPCAVIDSAEQVLQTYYVDPALGASYRDAVAARAASGAYVGLDGDALAKAMTSDLKAAHPDGHLQVFAPGNGIFGADDDTGEPPIPANLIEASGWVAPGIAYIRPMAFLERPEDLKRVTDFMDGHAGAKALIIDLRHHHGGELGEMNVLAADLYAEPTDLVLMRSRAIAWDRFENHPDTQNVFVTHRDSSVVEQLHRAIPRAGGARMADIPVFALTSRMTVSAGEHLALALKRTHRATLIGETTRGAGHYGEQVDLADGFSMFIPYGETFDPDTGKGWEGSGITPDIAVPAKDALNVALRSSGKRQ